MSAIATKRMGNRILVENAREAGAIRCRSAGLARSITPRLAWWADRLNPYTGRPWASLGELHAHVSREHDAAMATATRRARGSCFGGGR